MLQAGRFRVRFQVRSLNILIGLIFVVVLLPWDWLNLEQEWVSGMFLWDKARPVLKAHDLITFCELIFYKTWNLRRLTILSTSTAYYSDRFGFYFIFYGFLWHLVLFIASKVLWKITIIHIIGLNWRVWRLSSVVYTSTTGSCRMFCFFACTYRITNPTNTS
jgi:hypothetical protein